MSAEYFVPGLKGPQKYEPPEEHENDLDALLSSPMVLSYRGTRTEFYRIGNLARALNRSAVTIRKWQANGLIPPPDFKLPTKALGGKIRLYSRAQIEGLRNIAAEEGILDDTAKAITHTKFEERAWVMFEELKQQ